MTNLLKILILTLLSTLYSADLNPLVAGSADGLQTSFTKNQSNYVVDSPVGTAHLIARLDTGSLLFEAEGTQGKEMAITIQARLFGRLLKQFVHDHDQRRRLFVTFRETSDLWKRIIDAAIRSESWNQRSGGPRRGTVNAFIVEQINTRHLADEFDESFRAIGYVLRAKSVEEVIIDKVGPDRDAAVPVSGMLGFVAERER